MKSEQPPIELGEMKQLHNDLSFSNKLGAVWANVPNINVIQGAFRPMICRNCKRTLPAQFGDSDVHPLGCP